MAVSNENWVFGRAYASSRMRIAILSYWRENDPASDEEQETQIILCADGQVDSVLVPYHCVDVLEINEPRPHVLVVGLEGDVAVIDGNVLYRDFLDDSDNGPRGRGDIRSLARVSDFIFAVGMQRQVYQRGQPPSDTLAAPWHHYENGLSWSPLDIAGFNGLAGISPDELYAAGWRGELQICESGQWRPIELPTNLKLERVLVAPDGKVYLAGIRGVLLSGRGDSFEIIAQTATEESFWGMCWAFDTLWLASATQLFRLVDDDLVEVDPKLGDTMTFRCLTAADGRLWSVGSDHVIYTDDGQTWAQVFF
ncbi:MAG TPA: hypothetical protein ENI99_09860 [Sedimenticola sp.]|nr:hypothetical protein [Sedimenticola sp.]